jgi:hypothetical protein
MAVAERGSWEIRVVQVRPTIDCIRVWQNLHDSWVSEEIKSAWYTVMHEIIPTNESLAAIHLVDTDSCRQCGRPDILIHRLTECNNAAAIWEWIWGRVAMTLRTDPRHIPADGTFHPPL